MNENITQEIRTYGNPALRVKAVPVEKVTNETKLLVEQLTMTMYAGDGIGLAAEQIGRTEAICVVDIPKEMDLTPEGEDYNPQMTMPVVLINPEIIKASEKFESREEGCLSFPGIYVPVSRPVDIRVRYLDHKGNICEKDVYGLLARAIQHEMDHLNGILLVDRMSQVKRIALSGRLKRLKKSNLNRQG